MDVVPVWENLERRGDAKTRAARLLQQFAKDSALFRRVGKPTSERTELFTRDALENFHLTPKNVGRIGVEFDDKSRFRSLWERFFKTRIPLAGQRDDAAVEEIAEGRIEIQDARHGADGAIDRIEEENSRGGRGGRLEGREGRLREDSKRAFGAREESCRVESESYDVAQGVAASARSRSTLFGVQVWSRVA